MSEEVEELDELLKTFLNLEEIDVNIYRSTHLLPGRKDGRRVYGGQVVGQALMAANNTISSEFHPHSLHCQFIAPGDISRPIIYDVTRIRDGKSFCSRLVKALQNGTIIFTMIISFHISEPDSIKHQEPIPELSPPDECEDATDFFKRYASRVQ
uniref:Acyl-CoA thioesterase-like N-terminal HotDog domain-containing protein n=1 Tax=Panagrolaimus davidi TaxID=227884 RepID=A0A914PDS5_9BILA